MRRQSSTSRKQTPGARKSILVVGGHPVVREGLTRIINNAPDLVVCERTNAGARVPDAVSSLNPDAAVVHLSIDASVGLELIQALKAAHPRLPVIASVLHDQEELVKAAIEMGASSCITGRDVIGPVRRALAAG